uniref:DUF834 domain-containing protein n=1 Tax=Oryza punctata TaxID=4537 RepID=A0A0E0KNG8_ORYPU
MAAHPGAAAPLLPSLPDLAGGERGRVVAGGRRRLDLSALTCGGEEAEGQRCTGSGDHDNGSGVPDSGAVDPLLHAMDRRWKGGVAPGATTTATEAWADGLQWRRPMVVASRWASSLYCMR